MHIFCMSHNAPTYHTHTVTHAHFLCVAQCAHISHAHSNPSTFSVCHTLRPQCGPHIHTHAPRQTRFRVPDKQRCFTSISLMMEIPFPSSPVVFYSCKLFSLLSFCSPFSLHSFFFFLSVLLSLLGIASMKFMARPR